MQLSLNCGFNQLISIIYNYFFFDEFLWGNLKLPMYQINTLHVTPWHPTSQCQLSCLHKNHFLKNASLWKEFQNNLIKDFHSCSSMPLFITNPTSHWSNGLTHLNSTTTHAVQCISFLCHIFSCCKKQTLRELHLGWASQWPAFHYYGFSLCLWLFHIPSEQSKSLLLRLY